MGWDKSGHLFGFEWDWEGGGVWVGGYSRLGVINFFCL